MVGRVVAIGLRGGLEASRERGRHERRNERTEGRGGGESEKERRVWRGPGKCHLDASALGEVTVLAQVERVPKRLWRAGEPARRGRQRDAVRDTPARQSDTGVLSCKHRGANAQTRDPSPRTRICRDESLACQPVITAATIPLRSSPASAPGDPLSHRTSHPLSQHHNANGRIRARIWPLTSSRLRCGTCGRRSTRGRDGRR